MSVQLIIIAAYFALTVVIGILSTKHTKNSESFLGASMGLFSIVAASAGEWLGGTATTGVSEYGFDAGLSGAWYTIANGIGVMFLALLFAKLYRSLNSVTVPGIIEKFFGVNARIVSSALLTIVMLAVGLSQMIAAGKLGQSLMGFDFSVTVIIFAIIFIVYTLAGGMNAVSSTNKMHLFAMYGGVILAVIAALQKLGGWESLIDGLDVTKMSQTTIDAIYVAETAASSAGKSFTAPSQAAAGDYFNMLKIGGSRVSSWIIASLLGACTAQAGIQPVLAAKDVPTAKKACLITAVVVAPFGLLTAFLGMISKAMFNSGYMLFDKSGELLNGKAALPTLMMNLHPIIGGLVLASILAAILSTVSPIILSSGTMLTKDIYQRVLRPKASDAQVLKMSRITTAVSGIVCCFGAIALVNMSRVLDIVYAAYSLRGALFVVMLLGIYWKGASEKGACYSMILTGFVAIFWKLAEIITGSYPISNTITETYAGVAVALVATVILSLVFPKSCSTQ